MSDRVLVTYGSWCGSTAEVAEEIGKVLREGGSEVEVMPAAKVRDLSPYRAMVLGTAVRAGRCKGETTKFVRDHQEKLRQMPVALFSLGAQMKEDTPQNRETAAKPLQPLVEMIRPRTTATFGGVLEASRASFPVNLFVKVMPQGDWRDWDAVREWARGLKQALA